MDITIVIVNWNTCKILKDCLDSIYPETNNLLFEIIVIDNASSDDSVEVIKRDYPQVILIENSHNRGFAAANNQGLDIAKGRYVLLLNSDTIVLDEALERVISFADSHQNAAVIGCRVLNPDMSLQNTCFMFPSVLNMFLSATYLYKIFARNKFFGREQMTWWDRDDIREVDVVTGCFMLVRQKAIECIGGMDETFFMYAEETDWCYRFQKAGWQILFTPDSKIIHLGGQSTQKVRINMLIQLRVSILQFIKKNKGIGHWSVACLLTFTFWLARIPGWYLVALFNTRKHDHPTQTIKAYRKGLAQLFRKKTPKHDEI